MLFILQIKNLVHLVIPMRDVTVVEKVENSSVIQDGIHVSTKSKVRLKSLFKRLGSDLVILMRDVTVIEKWRIFPLCKMVNQR